MKLTRHFDEFLRDVVNLNQSRIDTLEERVTTIKSFIRGSAYAPKIVRFSAQGSWSHKTIIKPANASSEFDADLVVYVEPVEQWEPKEYISSLRHVFRESGTYKEMVSMRTRCVTLDYAGDFHLDIVPIVYRSPTFLKDERYEVCNRRDNGFELTDGDGFRGWWVGQNAVVSSNSLLKVARLLKYLRDTKKTFSAKSILLTTLIGRRVSFFDELIATGFDDVPTSLRTIVRRLDEWCQENPQMPDVENPALEGESFTRHWNQDVYANFREKMHQYRDWIDDAFGEESRDESIQKWRRVFGDDFAKGELPDREKRESKFLAERTAAGDLVCEILRYLPSNRTTVLSSIPASLPHVQPPQYPLRGSPYKPRIVAYERESKIGENIRPIGSGQEISKHSGIYFRVVQQNGLPYPTSFFVSWQVVNTGTEAEDSGCLRGGFEKSDQHGGRYESTLYRGVHWVQAFLVEKHQQIIVGISERFFVVIL